MDAGHNNGAETMTTETTIREQSDPTGTHRWFEVNRVTVDGNVTTVQMVGQFETLAEAEAAA